MWWKRLISARDKTLLEDRGTAAVELALAAPILALLMSGSWDFGNAVLQHERIENAARAGVSYGLQSAQRSTDFAGMTQAARNDANDQNNSLNVVSQQACACPSNVVAPTPGACGGGCPNGAPQWAYIQVQVQEPFRTVFTYPFVGNPINLTSQVSIRFQ